LQIGANAIKENLLSSAHRKRDLRPACRRLDNANRGGKKKINNNSTTWVARRWRWENAEVTGKKENSKRMGATKAFAKPKTPPPYGGSGVVQGKLFLSG